MRSHPVKLLKQLTVLLLAVVLLPSCSSDDEDLLPLVVFVQGRSMSKLPFVIAHDQGYERSTASRTSS